MKFDYADFIVCHAQSKTYGGLPQCRVAAHISGAGRCYVLGKPLQRGKSELHHRQAREHGGQDFVWNTIALDISTHKLIHARTDQEIWNWLKVVSPTPKQLVVINQLRMEAKRPPIKIQ